MALAARGRAVSFKRPYGERRRLNAVRVNAPNFTTGCSLTVVAGGATPRPASITSFRRLYRSGRFCTVAGLACRYSFDDADVVRARLVNNPFEGAHHGMTFPSRCPAHHTADSESWHSSQYRSAPLRTPVAGGGGGDVLPWPKSRAPFSRAVSAHHDPFLLLYPNAL